MIKTLHSLKKYPFFIITVIVFSILSTATNVVVPYLNGRFIDTLIATTQVDEVYRFAAIIIPLGLFGALASYLVNISLAKLSARTIFDNLSETITHIQKIPYDIFISRFNPAYLIARISNDIQVMFNFVINNFISVILQGAVACVALCIIASINIQILMISLLFLPLYIACYSYIKKPLFNRGVEYKENQNRFNKVVFEQVSNIREIKATVSFDKSVDFEKKSFGEYFRSLISLSRLQYAFTSLDGLMGLAFQSAVLIIGGMLIVNGRMTIGEFVIAATYFSMLLASVKYYFNLGKSYQDYKASAFRMSEIFSIENENNGDIEVKGIREISIKNVKYVYPNSTSDVIRDLTIEFKGGEISLISGPNGVGKSTLVNIILGLFQNITEGNILYDGIKLHDVDIYSARKNEIGALLQTSECPDITVEEYLSNHLNINEEQILEMIRLTETKELFNNSKFNIADYWGARLVSLSGGERQRVMLLRVFGRTKPVIILDEPSIGLDDTGVISLLEYIVKIKKDRLIIIVSHDQRFREIADKIIELTNKHIATIDDYKLVKTGAV